MFFLFLLPVLSVSHSPPSELTTISGRLTTTTKRTYFSSVPFNQTATYSVSITDPAVTRLLCDLAVSSGDASLHVSTSVSGKTVEWWSRQDGNELLEFKAVDKAFKGDGQGLVRVFTLGVIGAKRDFVSAFKLTITLESGAEYVDNDRAVVAGRVLDAQEVASFEVAEDYREQGSLWWGWGVVGVAVAAGIWVGLRGEKAGNSYCLLR